MIIGIYGDSDTALLTGGLLSLKENRVVYLKEKIEERVRFIFPDRWLNIGRLIFNRETKPDYLFVCDDPDAEFPEELQSMIDKETEIILFDSPENSRKGYEELKEEYNITHGLALMETARLQPDTLELFSQNACLILEKNRRVKKLLSQLKSYKINLKMVDDIAPYNNAYFLYRLTHLPAALTGTPLPFFLSYAEGRAIIRHILEEGFKTFEKMDKKIANLPALDPKKLLHRIIKSPDKFNAGRYLPDRNYSPLAKALITDNPPEEVSLPNRSIVKWATDKGTGNHWNSRLIALARGGLNRFKSPIELIAALE